MFKTKNLVSDWMSKTPISVTPDTSVMRVEDLMKQYKIRHIPVVNESDELVGIISLGDIRAASASDASSLSKYEQNYLLAGESIDDLMTPDPITINADQSISLAAELMLSKKISGLPVIQGKKLVGIITSSDIFRVVVKAFD